MIKGEKKENPVKIYKALLSKPFFDICLYFKDNINSETI